MEATVGDEWELGRSGRGSSRWLCQARPHAILRFPLHHRWVSFSGLERQRRCHAGIDRTLRCFWGTGNA